MTGKPATRIYRVTPADGTAPYNVEGSRMSFDDESRATSIFDDKDELVARVLNASIALVPQDAKQ